MDFGMFYIAVIEIIMSCEQVKCSNIVKMLKLSPYFLIPHLLFFFSSKDLVNFWSFEVRKWFLFSFFLLKKGENELEVKANTLSRINGPTIRVKQDITHLECSRGR